MDLELEMGRVRMKMGSLLSRAYAGISSGGYTPRLREKIGAGDRRIMLSEYYNDVLRWDDAAVLALDEIKPTISGVDFILDTGGTLTGHVHQAEGGAPIANAFVYAMDENFQYIAGSHTDDTGVYAIPLRSGQYFVYANAEGYGGLYYGGYDDPLATRVTILQDENTAIDFLLSPQATISGNVYESDGLTPVEGAYVDAWPLAGGQGMGATTDENGAFTIGGIATGEYVARASKDGYVEEFYLEADRWGTATAIQSVQPNDSPGIDFTLELAGSISGYVFETDGTTPIQGVNVCAVLNDPNGFINCDETGEDGYYQIARLAGNPAYKVLTWSPGYLRAFYSNIARFEDANLVEVSGGVDTSEVNIRVIKADALITGSVIYEDLSPASNVWLEAYHSDGWYVGIQSG